MPSGEGGQKRGERLPQGKTAAKPDLEEPIETPQVRNQGVILSAEGKEGGKAERGESTQHMQEPGRAGKVGVPSSPSRKFNN